MNQLLPIHYPKGQRKNLWLWRDDIEINELLEQRPNMDQVNVEFKLVSKQIKKRILKLRNMKLKQEAKEINSFANKRKIEEMYRAFKN